MLACEIVAARGSGVLGDDTPLVTTITTASAVGLPSLSTTLTERLAAWLKMAVAGVIIASSAIFFNSKN
jgi:hypothetical protein